MPSNGPTSEARPPMARLRVLVPWLMAGMLLFFLGQRLVASWDRTVVAGLHFSPGWLVVSLGLLGGYLLARALLWHRLTLAMGVGIPTGRALVAWFSSQAGKYIPGKVFLYLGRLYLYGREGRSAALVSLTFALETFLSSVAALTLAMLGNVLQHLPGVPAFGPWLSWGGLLMILVALHPRLWGGAVRRLGRIFGIQPLERLPPWRALVSTALLYLLSWGVCGWGFFSFLRSFYPLAVTEAAFVAGSFSLAAVVGMVVVLVPAGLGVREGVLAMLLSRILPEGVAVAGALLARGWFLVGELGGLAASQLLVWMGFGLHEGKRSDAAGRWGAS